MKDLHLSAARLTSRSQQVESRSARDRRRYLPAHPNPCRESRWFQRRGSTTQTNAHSLQTQAIYFPTNLICILKINLLSESETTTRWKTRSTGDSRLQRHRHTHIENILSYIENIYDIYFIKYYIKLKNI